MVVLSFFSHPGFLPGGRGSHRTQDVTLLDHLHEKNELIRLNDRRYLSAKALEEIKQRVSKVIGEKGGLTLADSKEVLGYGRSVGVPVLEYLDSVGFTRREGGKRVLINGEKI